MSTVENTQDSMVRTVDSSLDDDDYNSILTRNTMCMFEDSIVNFDIKNASTSLSTSGSGRLKQLPPLYIKLYTKVEVYETSVNGQNLMRRCKDDWVNSTQILKAAEFPKSKRTRILEKEIQIEEHEKLQGGNGSVQGTWVPLDIARKMAKKHNLFSSIESATKLKNLQLILYFDKDKLKDKLHVLSQRQTTTPSKRKKANQSLPSSNTNSFKKVKNGNGANTNNSKISRTSSTSSLTKLKLGNVAHHQVPASPISPTPMNTLQFKQYQQQSQQHQKSLVLQHPPQPHYLSMPPVSANTPISTNNASTSTPTTSSFCLSNFTNKLSNSTPTTTISPQILTFQGLQLDPNTTPNPSTPVSAVHLNNKFLTNTNHITPLATVNIANSTTSTRNNSSIITPMAQPPTSMNSSLLTPMPTGVTNTSGNISNLNVKLSSSTPNLQLSSGNGIMHMTTPANSNTFNINHNHDTSSDIHTKSPLNSKNTSSFLAGQTSIFHVDVSKPAKKKRGRKPKNATINESSNNTEKSEDLQQKQAKVDQQHKNENVFNYNKQLIEYFRKGNENNIPKFILKFDISNKNNHFQINSPIDSEGHSTLHWAAAMGNIKLVQILISDKVKASPLVENSLGLNPLCRSVTFNNCYKKKVFNKMVDFLKSALFVPDSNNRIILHYLCQFAEKKDREASILYYFDTVLNELKFQNDYCNKQMLKLKKEKILAMNLNNANQSQDQDNKFIHVASNSSSSSSSMSSAASSNFQLLNNTQNHSNATPISPSSQNSNNLDISIDNEKDSFMKMIINHRDNQGNTPLHLAIRSKCGPLIKQLLSHGADISLMNLNGDIPLNMLKALNGQTLLADNNGLSSSMMFDESSYHAHDSMGSHPLTLSGMKGPYSHNQSNIVNPLVQVGQSNEFHSFPQIVANHNTNSQYMFDDSAGAMMIADDTNITSEQHTGVSKPATILTPNIGTTLTSSIPIKKLYNMNMDSTDATNKDEVYQVPIANEDGVINLASFKTIYNEFFNKLEYSLSHDFQSWDEKTKEAIEKNNKKIADLQLVQDQIRNKLNFIFSDFVISSTNKKKGEPKDTQQSLLIMGKDSTDSDDTINEEDDDEEEEEKEEMEYQADINNEQDRQILKKLEALLNSNSTDFSKVLNEELLKKMINLEHNFFQKDEIFKKLVDRSQAKSVADFVIRAEQKINQAPETVEKDDYSVLREKVKLIVELSKFQKRRSMKVSQFMETCVNHTISHRFNNYRKLISISCDLKFESIDELIDGIEQAVILSNTVSGPNASSGVDGDNDHTMMIDSIDSVYNDTSTIQL